jgi:hypothetical protein
MCPTANNGGCCEEKLPDGAASYTSFCDTNLSGCATQALPDGGFNVAIAVGCDSQNDCAASSEICCFAQVYLAFSTSCTAPSACVTTPADAGGLHIVGAFYVCDPNASPPECPVGKSCLPSADAKEPGPGLYLCQ